jgi:ABC-type branched-subunit amino acid transport system ATPase component
VHLNMFAQSKINIFIIFKCDFASVCAHQENRQGTVLLSGYNIKDNRHGTVKRSGLCLLLTEIAVFK